MLIYTKLCLKDINTLYRQQYLTINNNLDLNVAILYSPGSHFLNKIDHWHNYILIINLYSQSFTLID